MKGGEREGEGTKEEVYEASEEEKRTNEKETRGDKRRNQQREAIKQ
jgi:hypothetical protein